MKFILAVRAAPQKNEPKNLQGKRFSEGAHCQKVTICFQLMVNWWFGARWFGIRIGVPLCNNPFQKEISGIQTENDGLEDVSPFPGMYSQVPC